MEETLKQTLLRAVDEYFGMVVENMMEFKLDFKEEYLPHTQAENLLNFLLYLERQSK
jgi:hypothetical protein